MYETYMSFVRFVFVGGECRVSAPKWTLVLHLHPMVSPADRAESVSSLHLRRRPVKDMKAAIHGWVARSPHAAPSNKFSDEKGVEFASFWVFPDSGPLNPLWRLATPRPDVSNAGPDTRDRAAHRSVICKPISFARSALELGHIYRISEDVSTTQSKNT